MVVAVVVTVNAEAGEVMSSPARMETSVARACRESMGTFLRT
jgi:hypothetical protein